ncbi:hypothetical protein GGX14DRAFT_609901 [Mycena pura]|uniref:Uncharacterized protein n=1 Tax=Mycena pura TaxID=153505 RepID=A0AAD6VNE1_9AGAR|nr:hypothetical protein GGX14DRAFT_609901 [Mycena pura]
MRALITFLPHSFESSAVCGFFVAFDNFTLGSMCPSVSFQSGYTLISTQFHTKNEAACTHACCAACARSRLRRTQAAAPARRTRCAPPRCLVVTVARAEQHAAHELRDGTHEHGLHEAVQWRPLLACGEEQDGASGEERVEDSAHGRRCGGAVVQRAPWRDTISAARMAWMSAAVARAVASAEKADSGGGTLDTGTCSQGRGRR